MYIPGLDSIRAHIYVEDVISHAPCLHFIEEFDFIEVCFCTQIVSIYGWVYALALRLEVFGTQMMFVDFLGLCSTPSIPT